MRPAHAAPVVDNKDAGRFVHGWRRRIAMARSLGPESDCRNRPGTFDPNRDSAITQAGIDAFAKARSPVRASDPAAGSLPLFPNTE